MSKNIRFKLDDPFIEDMMRKLNYKNGNAFCIDAMTIYKWIIKEMLQGRIVLTTDKDGGNVKEPVNDFLMKLEGYALAKTKGSN